MLSHASELLELRIANMFYVYKLGLLSFVHSRTSDLQVAAMQAHDFYQTVNMALFVYV